MNFTQSLHPMHSLGSSVPMSFIKHHTDLHPTAPGRALSQHERQDLPAKGLGSRACPVCFLRQRRIFLASEPPCQCLCLTGVMASNYLPYLATKEGCLLMALSGPINTPRNFTVASDFVLLSSLCKLLSALEVDGCSTKCSLGPIIT